MPQVVIVILRGGSYLSNCTSLGAVQLSCRGCAIVDLRNSAGNENPLVAGISVLEQVTPRRLRSCYVKREARFIMHSVKLVRPKRVPLESRAFRFTCFIRTYLTEIDKVVAVVLALASWGGVFSPAREFASGRLICRWWGRRKKEGRAKRSAIELRKFQNARTCRGRRRSFEVVLSV